MARAAIKRALHGEDKDAGPCVPRPVCAIVRIGAATAFFRDRRMGIAPLLANAEQLNAILSNLLAGSVMGELGCGEAAGSGPGLAIDFRRSMDPSPIGVIARSEPPDRS